jgi:uncharacterized protein
MTRFLDTNILMRYFTKDDPAKAQAALALLQRVEAGDERVLTSIKVIFETVFLPERRYKVPKQQVRALVESIVALRGLQLTGKALCLQTLALYEASNVSFADAYSAVYMQSRGVTEVYSWDTDFDTLPGLTRVEPA